MKLLYITAFPPNQKTGGQTFSLNAIKELSEQYIIDVFYFSYPEHNCEIQISDNISAIKELPIGRFDFIKKFWIHPIFSRRFNKSILREVQSITDNYDVLYFDFSQVALYSLYIKHPYKVLRMHDVLYQKFSRKNLLLEKWVTNTEKKVLKSFNKVFVPSKKDAVLLKSVYGINAYYTNEYLKPVHFPEYVEQKKQFVFYGYWKRSENTDGLIWFVEKVLPLIKGKIKILVIGGGLDTSIKEKYLKNNQIDYLGFVEKPLDIILESSAVFVPLFQGAGIKVKVIDAFTAGTPVIGTELAFEGLPEIKGLSCCAQDAQQFAAFINTFKSFTYEEKKLAASEFNKIYNYHHLLEQI